MEFIAAVWRFITEHATVLSTVVTALFTGTLAFVTNRAVNLARDEFNATHRPKIVVHSVEYFDKRHKITNENNEPVINETVAASLLCFNAGDGNAAKVEVRGEIIVTNDLGLDVQRSLVKTFNAVNSGMKLRVEIHSERSLTDCQLAQARTYCIGTIAYFDGSDGRRETGFCFRLAFQPARWEHSSLAEFQYAY